MTELVVYGLDGEVLRFTVFDPPHIIDIIKFKIEQEKQIPPIFQKLCFGDAELQSPTQIPIDAPPPLAVTLIVSLDEAHALFCASTKDKIRVLSDFCNLSCRRGASEAHRAEAIHMCLFGLTDNVEVRMKALEVLGKIAKSSDNDVLSALVVLLAARPRIRRLRNAATEVLLEIYGGELLTHPTDNVRETALRHIVDDILMDATVDCLRDKAVNVRRTAFETLRSIIKPTMPSINARNEDNECRPAISTCRLSGLAEERNRVLARLVGERNRDVIDNLTQFLEYTDNELDVRHSAMSLRRELAEKEDEPIIHDILCRFGVRWELLNVGEKALIKHMCVSEEEDIIDALRASSGKGKGSKS